MNKFPLIISFYTKNTPYEYEVQKLIASCKKFSLEVDIEGVDSAGSWERNCGYKPFFILKKLQEHKRGVLWIDADGEVVRAPSYLPAFEADVAVLVRPACANDHPSKVGSGTLYANYTEKSLLFIKRWAELSLDALRDPERKEEFWDQISLRDTLFSSSLPSSIGLLPLSYMKIFDHPLDSQVCLEPVIEHHQASRLYKKWVADPVN